MRIILRHFLCIFAALAVFYTTAHASTPFSKYGVIPAVSITIFALTIGEACSLFYLLLKLKKTKIPSFNNTYDEKKAVWKMAGLEHKKRKLCKLQQ